MSEINYHIIGTEKDMKLLRKIFTDYQQKTKSSIEKENVECYLHLLNQAEKKAKQRSKQNAVVR